MRSSLPEFVRWQNALRPEDSGHYDAGVHSDTGGDAAVQAFDAKVAGQLESRLGVVRNNFFEEEARLWTEYATAEQQSRSGIEALRLIGQDGGADAPVHEPTLRRAAAVVILAVLGVATATVLNTVAQWPAIFAVVLALAIGSGAYACGLLVRQARTAVRRQVSLGLLVLLTLLSAALVSEFRFGDNDHLERLGAALAVAALLSSIALVAFLSNVSDTNAHRLRLAVVAGRQAMLALRARREENRAFHINVAERHRALALQIGNMYRHAYRQSVGRCGTCPSALDQAPQLPSVDPAWFELMRGAEQ